jgi:hypothetical protein
MKTIKMTKAEFTEKYPSLANRMDNYKRAFDLFVKYEETDREGANRWMRSAESDWAMAAEMAERQDVDILGAAALFGISNDDSMSKLGRACRQQLGQTIIEPA